MKVYVDFVGENIMSYHSKPSAAPLTEVIQDDPVIDVSKLSGYKLVEQEDDYHLVYDAEKYKESILKQQSEEATKAGEEALRKLIQLNVLRTASDEDAYAMRCLYPTWSADSIEYKKNDRLMYNDKFYKVLQNHTSQESWTPDEASSLFVEISDPSVEYPEWKQPINAETAYNIGDKVTFEGKKYVSTINANTWSSTEYPAGWNLVEE